MLPLPNQKRAYRAAVAISAYSGDFDNATGLTDLLADGRRS
jgi:hypothetical protein